MPSGTIRVRYREFLATLLGANSAFVITNQFTLNPGISGTFPWLSGIALNYNKWRLNRLKLHYLSECATTEQGVVVVALNTDAAANQPGSKQQLLLLEHSLRMNPWDSSSVEFRDLKTLGPWLFTRTVPLFPSVPNSSYQSSTIDVHTYDAGVLYTAVSGTTTDTFGDLYIEYEIEFDEPVASPGRSTFVGAFSGTAARTALGAAAGASAWLTTICQNAVQGDGQIRSTLAVLPPIGLFASGDYFYLPQGQYIVSCAMSFSGAALVPPTITLSATNSTTAISQLVSHGQLNAGSTLVTLGATWTVNVVASNAGPAAPVGASGDSIRLQIASTSGISACTEFLFLVTPFANAQ